MLPKPLRDSNGVVIPYDCPEIFDEYGIIRRISNEQTIIDKQTNKRRISSIAFKPSVGINAGMSVDLEDLIIRAGVDPKKFVTTPRWIGSVKFNAKSIRSLNLIIGYDPLEETASMPSNPYHGEVWGVFTKGQIRQLQQIAQWYVPIDNVLLR
jgi:hypothetical protein